MQLPLNAGQVLRLIPGAQTRIARSLQPPVDPSLVSRVAAGQKRSARVSRAILKFMRGYQPLLKIMETEPNIGKPSGENE